MFFCSPTHQKHTYFPQPQLRRFRSLSNLSIPTFHQFQPVVISIILACFLLAYNTSLHYRCTIVAHFTDKISVYFTHFLAKIPNSSRNFFFQLLPVLILRQSLFSFDQKSTLPLIFSSFMYLPPHRHYYSNLSIQPEKCIFSRINKSTIVQTKKQ